MLKGSKKQFCKYGHDTFICGRAKNLQCKECISLYKKTYYNLNVDRIKVVQQSWKKAHKIEYNAYHRKLYETDINYKLASRIRNRIGDILRGKVKVASAIDMLGCNLDFLKSYIESQFVEGMSWDNWCKFGWHIDHIIPLDSFDLTDKEQFAKAVHYTNLQPMWAIDNWSKNNKLEVINND